MLDEQTIRAIETMAQCGLELDTLCSMFPQIAKNDIEEIKNRIMAAMKNMEDNEDDTPNISCNCS